MDQIAHEVNGTTYYACGECGSCGCGIPGHEAWGYKPNCSRRIPAEWHDEDCVMMGPKRFMICSHCRRPPCDKPQLTDPPQ